MKRDRVYFHRFSDRLELGTRCFGNFPSISIKYAIRDFYGMYRFDVAERQLFRNTRSAGVFDTPYILLIFVMCQVASTCA